MNGPVLGAHGFHLRYLGARSFRIILCQPFGALHIERCIEEQRPCILQKNPSGRHPPPIRTSYTRRPPQTYKQDCMPDHEHARAGLPCPHLPLALVWQTPTNRRSRHPGDSTFCNQVGPSCTQITQQSGPTNSSGGGLLTIRK